MRIWNPHLRTYSMMITVPLLQHEQELNHHCIIHIHTRDCPLGICTNHHSLLFPIGSSDSTGKANVIEICHHANTSAHAQLHQLRPLPHSTDHAWTWYPLRERFLQAMTIIISPNNTLHYKLLLITTWDIAKKASCVPRRVYWVSTMISVRLPRTDQPRDNHPFVQITSWTDIQHLFAQLLEADNVPSDSGGETMFT